ncbi:RICIN domain-containing protein [Actinacidiphila oryziradicis]|uniref:Ricin B lectin domain-containing protein n=1 Tax=Actinacidiphila oryziradicis TaxID=2571141 RepID=A0A4U0RX03_9ACTN|nr:hypothetical protein [Actinacidiphila oryziradicis]TJZ99340.1 hypothetical protein FCI23_46140 [Actinacidiphila oryziradicis]
MIKNVATGKCLQGTDNGQLYAYSVKMVTCNSGSSTQHWGQAGSKIMMVRSGGSASQICLSVPKSPSGDFARTVVTVGCGTSGYQQTMQFGVTSNYPLAPAGNPNCYIGHYSTGDTWASCYVNDGSYTRWTWIAA